MTQPSPTPVAAAEAPRVRAQAVGAPAPGSRRGLFKRVLLLIVAVILVSIVATTFATTRRPPAMSAADAVTFTRQAFEDAGVEEADVGTEPRTGRFDLKDERSVPVWIVPSEIRGELVELYVPSSSTLPCDDSLLNVLPGNRACPADRAINLDDEVQEGRFLFTDEQFDSLEDFRGNPALDRQRDDRAGPTVVAVVALVVVGLALLRVATRRRGRRRSPSA